VSGSGKGSGESRQRWACRQRIRNEWTNFEWDLLPWYRFWRITIFILIRIVNRRGNGSSLPRSLMVIACVRMDIDGYDEPSTNKKRMNEFWMRFVALMVYVPDDDFHLYQNCEWGTGFVGAMARPCPGVWWWLLACGWISTDTTSRQRMGIE